jgi:hypothetical protein
MSQRVNRSWNLPPNGFTRITRNQMIFARVNFYARGFEKRSKRF